MHPRLLAGFAPIAAALVWTSSAFAHDAWVAPAPGGYAVFFGHADSPAAFPPERVSRLRAVDAQGGSLGLTQQPGDRRVDVRVQGMPALLVLDFDEGYWSVAPGAHKAQNKPRGHVPGAISGSHTVKFGKTIVTWSPIANRAQGQRLEIVPLAAHVPLAGGVMPVRVLWDGKPLAGARIVRAHLGRSSPIVADDGGVAQVPVSSGRQFLSVSHKAPLRNDPGADSYSASANLLFTVKP